MAEPTVSAGIVHGLIDFAVIAGVDRTMLLNRSGITAADLADRDNRVAMSKYQALMLAAKALSGNPAIALHYADHVDLSELSVVGLITRASPTMMDALVQLNRFGRLVAEVDTGIAQRFEIVRESDQIWMVDNRLNANAFPELTEVTFARLVAGPKRFADTLKLGAIHFTHKAPTYAHEYDRIFGAPVTFESHRNAMLIDESWLTHQVALTPQYVFGILTRHADAMLQNLENVAVWRGRTEGLLLPILHTGVVNIERIADEMGMSRQTLYRKLKAEGTTFEKLLDELRYKMALHYLSGCKVSVNETAYLVGFSDRAAFSRAFKRWTGHRPKVGAP